MVYGTLMQLHFPMLSGPSQMEAVFTNALPWMLAIKTGTRLWPSFWHVSPAGRVMLAVGIGCFKTSRTHHYCH